MKGPDRVCAEIMARDFGVIHLREALGAGMDRRAVERRVASGVWELLLHKTFRMAGAPDSWEQRAMAACKWAGPGSALSGGAAARVRSIHGFERADVEIATVGRKRPHSLDFKVHRCDRYLLPEIEKVGSFPITSVRRTLLDLAGAKHPLAEKALDQALRERATSLPRLWLFYEEEWVRGRRGIAILGGWLRNRSPGLAPTDTELEDDLWSLITRARLPLPLRQFQVRLPSRKIRFDFAYPDRLIAIEADSYGFHGDRQSFDQDRQRDNEAALLGWIVLRFTWAQIRFQPDYVVDTVRQHLRLRSPGFAEQWARGIAG